MRQGFVYVARATSLNWIKIGWAKDIAFRLCDVARTCGSDLELLGCAPGTQADERSLHRQFDAARIGLEWFRPTEELLAHARAMPSPVVINFVGVPDSRRGMVGYIQRRVLGHQAKLRDRAERRAVRAVRRVKRLLEKAA